MDGQQRLRHAIWEVVRLAGRIVFPYASIVSNTLAAAMVVILTYISTDAPETYKWLPKDYSGFAYQRWLIGLAVSFYVIGALTQICYSRRQDNMRKEFEKLKERFKETTEELTDARSIHDAVVENHEETIEEMVGTISSMYESLLINVAEECESLSEGYRLSLYDCNNRHFRLYARMSTDPLGCGLSADELTKPIDKGCLSIAWRTGKSLKSFGSATYDSEHHKLGYTQDEVEKFTLRPRSICAFRFPMSAGSSYDGVLVVEVVRKMTMSELGKVLQEVQESPTWPRIMSAYKAIPRYADPAPKKEV